jgi:hypothetical protein
VAGSSRRLEKKKNIRGCVSFNQDQFRRGRALDQGEAWTGAACRGIRVRRTLDKVRGGRLVLGGWNNLSDESPLDRSAEGT